MTPKKPTYQELLEENIKLKEQINKFEDNCKKFKIEEQNFQMMVENSPDTIIIQNVDGTAVFVSNKIKKLTGFEPEYFTGKNLPIEHIYKDDLNICNENFNKIISGASFIEFEYRIVTKNDKIIWVQHIARPIFTENKITGIQNNIRDISNQKRIEIELKESNLKYQTYFEQSFDGIVTINPETAGFIEFNRQVCEQLEYTPEEFSKLTIFDVEAIETEEQTRKKINEVLTKGHTIFQTKQRTKSEKIIDIEVHAQLMDIGEKKVYHCVWRDITNIKKNEQELIKAKELAEENGLRFRLMYENTSVGIGIISLDYKFSDVNPAFCKMLGYTKEEFIGKTIADITHHDTIEQNIILQKQLKEGKIPSFQLEKKFIHKDGHTVYGLLNSTLIKNHKDEPVYFLGNVNDITEKKLAEEELTKKEKLFGYVIESAGDAIYLTDFETRKIILTNQQACKSLGYTKEELLTKKIEEITPTFFNNSNQQKIWNNPKIDNIALIEVSHKRKDGSSFPVEVRITTIEYKGKKALLEFARDITQRKNAETKIKENERNYRLLFENSPIGTYIANTEGQVLNVNQSALNILGSPSEEATKQINVLTFQPLVQNGYSDKFKECIETGKIINFEIIYKSKWNKTTYLDNIIVPLKNEQGEIEKIYTMMQDISARKNAEDLLNKSIIRWESLFNNSPSAIAIYKAVDNGEDFEFTDFNTTAQLTDKISKDKVIGKKLSEVFPTAKELGILKSFQKVWKTGDIEYLDAKFYKDNRLEGWRENIIYKLSTGEIVAIYQDVTDRVRAEQEKFKLNSIIENSLNEIYVFDTTNFKFEYVNRGALQNIGYTLDEMKKMTPIDIKPEITTEKFKEIVKPLLNKEKEKIVFETLHQRKNGTLYNVEVHLQLISNENEKFYAAVILDITNRKKAEQEIIEAKNKAEENEQNLKMKNEEYEAVNEELKQTNQELSIAKQKIEESEEKFRAAFITSPDAININKMDGEYVEINEGFTTLTGYTRKDTIEKLSSEIKIWSIPEDRVRLIEGLKADGIVNNLESVFRTKKGKLIPALMSAKIIYLNNEPHILSITRNISERKKFENEILEAKRKAEESDALKTAFLQNMSHEIRTPLNAICGFSDMLNTQNTSEVKRKEFINIILKSSNQLLSIVNDILTISSLETNQEKVNITAVQINSIISLLNNNFKNQAENQNISLFTKVNLPDEQSVVYTDKQKLTQILNNLLSNAFKFTQKGFIEFGYNVNNDYLEFFVKDSGIGISKELHEKIFERFRQADLSINKKYGGTGLGLSISKGFVELLGGKIRLESQINNGSTFYFTIPFKPVSSNNSSIRETKKTEDKKFKVLVAEDEEYNFLYIEEIFSSLNVKLLHSKNGKETVEMYKKNSDVDLILMDIKMPELDGHSAAILIKEINHEIKIIAQSAYILEHERKKYNDVFDDFLVKPFSKNELIEKISKYIEIVE